MKFKKKATAYDIKVALAKAAEKRKNLFFEECKNGSSYFPGPNGLLILDGYEIHPSWAHQKITGYEVKISRSDFQRDNKWNLYEMYCNCFYFVVPTGLIDKIELPEEVGLIYYNPDTKVLKTVRKAEFREIEEPVEIYKYIIYNRCGGDTDPFAESNRTEYARAYIEDKAKKNMIGQELGSKMAKELESLRRQVDGLKTRPNRAKIMKEVGDILDRHYYINPWNDYNNEDVEKVPKEVHDGLLRKYSYEGVMYRAKDIMQTSKMLYEELQSIGGKEQDNGDSD